MSSRRKKINKEEKPDLLKGLAGLSLEEISGLQKTIPTLLESKIQQMAASNDFEEIMKANLFLNQRDRLDNGKMQSIFFNPNDVGDSGKGYKENRGALSFDTLRRMGDIFIVRSVVNTRVEQVQNFLHFSVDEQKEGYTIRKKKSLFEKDFQNKEIEEGDQGKIEHIIKFLENGGLNDKWANYDTFQDFGRKIVFDSLTLDQLAFEITRDRGWNLARFRAIDASLIRLLDSVDPRYRDEFERYRFKGYLPRFCMSWQGQILQNPTTHESVVFYPWELGYGIRNKSTSIYRNGYGTSELETLVEIITWILWGMQYNGNFFSKGSQPKGFINIKNGNIDNATLNEFRQAWTQTMRGVGNSHRTPIMQGIDLEWVDLQKSNRDMEFTEWVKFLIVITCSVYRIDPSELGFQFKDQTQIFGQNGQHERLNHSRDKGLKPLLIFLQNIINHYIVDEMFDGEFEFAFTGIEIEDESKQVELDKKKLDGGMVSMEDIFRKYSGRQFNPDTDTILNSVYQTAKMNEMNSAMYAEPVPGEDGENPFDQYEKSIENNPIEAAAMEYIAKNLYKN
jgi:hypothetical protein